MLSGPQDNGPQLTVVNPENRSDDLPYIACNICYVLSTSHGTRWLRTYRRGG